MRGLEIKPRLVEQHGTTVKNVAERLQSVLPEDNGCLSRQHALKERGQVIALVS